jgi:uncharacterized protein DUF6056
LNWFISAALGLPLLVYAWIGAYSRYTADDFCWAGILRTEGFTNAQVHWYTQYSPRFAFTFLVNLTELIGPSVVPVLPAMAIVLWLGTLTWTLSRFGLGRLRAFLLAEVAALATLQTAPDLPQSLYWQTGLLTYLLPLILASFLIGWIRVGSQRWWALAVSLLTAFFAGGLSETYLIPQNVALSLGLLVALRCRARRAHVAVALLGGVLALAIIVASPSIGPRVQGTPADLWLAASAAIATAAVQMSRFVRFFAFTILMCLAAGFLFGGCLPRLDRQRLILVSAAVLITLPFCDFPSFYAQNGNPPTRSLIVPGAILVGYVLFLGIAAGQRAHGLQLARWPIALTALLVVPIVIAATSLPDVSTARTYASLFDAEDQQIRGSVAAGQTDVTVGSLPKNLGEDFITSDRDNWFNMCVARYYGARSIATPS